MTIISVSSIKCVSSFSHHIKHPLHSSLHEIIALFLPLNSKNFLRLLYLSSLLIFTTPVDSLSTPHSPELSQSKQASW